MTSLEDIGKAVEDNANSLERIAEALERIAEFLGLLLDGERTLSDDTEDRP